MSKQLRTYPHSPPQLNMNSNLLPTDCCWVEGGGGVGAQLLVTDIEQNVL